MIRSDHRGDPMRLSGLALLLLVTVTAGCGGTG